MAIVYSGIIIEITNKYAADEDDVVVYIDGGERNSITGLHISKCVGFTPKVGDKVNIFKDNVYKEEESMCECKHCGFNHYSEFIWCPHCSRLRDKFKESIKHDPREEK